MMQVQKGQVKYKDRTDIICTYGVVDNGKQYYFLDGEKLGKGRIVASTALVEAIDPMVSASNIGVIDSDGLESGKMSAKIKTATTAEQTDTVIFIFNFFTE